MKGAIHNVYVTPDGKYVVSGSIPGRMLTFERAADGSTSRMFVQLSDYHGIAVVDFATRKEVSRFLMADIPGEERHTQGLQAAPAHGLGVTPDGKQVYVAAAGDNAVTVVNTATLREIARIPVGQGPQTKRLGAAEGSDPDKEPDTIGDGGTRRPDPLKESV